MFGDVCVRVHVSVCPVLVNVCLGCKNDNINFNKLQYFLLQHNTYNTTDHEYRYIAMHSQDQDFQFHSIY